MKVGVLMTTVNLKVGELEEHLAKRKEGSVVAKLGDFSVSEDASELTVNHGFDNSVFSLDQGASAAVAKYLKIPVSYYEKLTPDFRSTLLRYEMERHKDADTVLETLNGDIVAVHQPGQLMLPLTKVAKVVTGVFEPEDSVRRMIVSESLFHLDITTDAHKLSFATPGVDGMVDDITEAGIRILAHPFRSVSPSVNAYAERLTCANGQTTEERMGRISLKGRTVDEVIQELELAAQTILGQLDGFMDRLNSTRTMPAPGSPQAFAAQLAREANVSRKVLDKVLDIVNQLPEPVSIWDVNQAFTSVANQSENYATMVRLQTLGGSLGFDAETMVKRCGTCEQRL